MEIYLLPAIPEGFCMQKVYLQPVCASEGRADGLQQAWEHQYLQVTPYSVFFHGFVLDVLCLMHIALWLCALQPFEAAERCCRRHQLLQDLLCHSFSNTKGEPIVTWTGCSTGL